MCVMLFSSVVKSLVHWLVLWFRRTITRSRHSFLSASALGRATAKGLWNEQNLWKAELTGRGQIKLRLHPQPSQQNHWSVRQCSNNAFHCCKDAQNETRISPKVDTTDLLWLSEWIDVRMHLTCTFPLSIFSRSTSVSDLFCWCHTWCVCLCGNLLYFQVFQCFWKICVLVSLPCVLAWHRILQLYSNWSNYNEMIPLCPMLALIKA